LNESWKRTLALMVCVQATMSASIQIPVPFFPQFLEQNGVFPLTHVEYWSGAILSVSALSAAVFSPIWGGLGDRIGRKTMVLRSSLASGVALGLMGLCTLPWEMLGLRAFSGAFSGFSTAAMALVATQVPEERLGYALGWLSTGQIAGTLIGPLIGGLLADHLHNYRAVYAYSAVGTIVLAIGCVMFVHEKRQPNAVAERNSASLFARLVAVATHRDLAPMFLVIMLAQITAIGIQPILPIFVGNIVGNVPWKATVTGLAVAATGIAGLLSAPFLGRRSDEIGYRRVLLITLSGATLFTLPQALAYNVWAFIALRFGVGVFLGGILPSANAMIGRIAKPENRGQIYGITSTAQFLGRFIGPLLGAGIAGYFGIPAVFAVIGTLMLANLLWVWTRVPQRVT
jgi:DHA1 family multidrug resistance protein-like MFS transporter